MGDSYAEIAADAAEVDGESFKTGFDADADAAEVASATSEFVALQERLKYMLQTLSDDGLE